MGTGAIVLNTGRCGSTLLSDLFAEHPETNSIQEFFVGIVEQFMAPSAKTGWTGEEFWQTITRPSYHLRVLNRINRLPSEFRYPLDKLPAGGDLDMSCLLGFSLPAITDDPDRLLAELAEVVPGFPKQPAGEHCRQLFELLTEWTGKSRWIERTGGSSGVGGNMLEMFPDARVIYLNRDCVDTAFSMSRMPFAVLLYIDLLISEATGVSPYKGEPYNVEDVPEHLRHLLPVNLTAETLDSFADSPEFVLSSVGTLAVLDQLTEWPLRAVPADRVLRVSYEDLVGDPRKCLARIGAFLELSDHEQWAERVAPRVRTQPTRNTVDDEQRRHLHAVFDRMRTDPSLILRISAGNPDWLSKWIAETSTALTPETTLPVD